VESEPERGATFTIELPLDLDESELGVRHTPGGHTPGVNRPSHSLHRRPRPAARRKAARRVRNRAS
jgi:hypothetical protein